MADGFERTAEEREQARRGRQRARPRSGANGRKAPPRRRPTRPRRKHSWVGRIFALLPLALGVVLIWFLVQLFQPFHGSPHGSVTVTVPARANARQIGDELAKDGVVPSGFFFELRAMLAGQRGSLLAGTYHLQQGMTYGGVLKILTTPPPAAKTTNITIIEGRTRGQIDALLRAQGVKGSYAAATRRSPLINFAAYGAPRHTPDLEGFLFPDTYQLVEPISVQKLVSDQLSTFRQQFASVNLAYTRSQRLTPYEVLIVASMVQAEAATAHDAPLVASVIYNRLRIGMPLQIDATTRYATGNYTRPLTQSQLSSPSPYNTRIHKGLPPTPIDNPGLAAIQAAAHPAETNFLYFVAKVCGNGSSVFESGYNQFLADQAKYQRARSARGGRSPERCS
ncbi:MAG: endolytic transglycosylase MltG [Solirubrobacterales bacterium]|nr:endolytic transglycosylase MltG [Solirubrobacterales bacterium]MBV9363750.1 endolytic transglycosylase MltG [Solirubrobacterales bacterium]MBV9682689.1 endolytic transglycosylase MltG [Solirubrobacterales bacterium]MBV9807785.1 endolytic transglycosylase MltG [Solirubrobacterales bacterium]